MKLLFDQNLSPQLPTRLSDLFHHAADIARFASDQSAGLLVIE